MVSLLGSDTRLGCMGPMLYRGLKMKSVRCVLFKNSTNKKKKKAARKKKNHVHKTAAPHSPGTVLDRRPCTHLFGRPARLFFLMDISRTVLTGSSWSTNQLGIQRSRWHLALKSDRSDTDRTTHAFQEIA